MTDVETLRAVIGNDPRFRVTTHLSGFADIGCHYLVVTNSVLAKAELEGKLQLAGLGTRTRYFSSTRLSGKTEIMHVYLL